MLGFGVGTFAMIVILSTFNGFEVLVEDMINHYDPDIKITSTSSKVFHFSQLELDKIKVEQDVVAYSEVLEEKVVVKYNNRQEIARIKGVDANYSYEKFDSLMILGELRKDDETGMYAVFGGGLASKISLFPNSSTPVSVYVPKRNVEFNSLNPEASLSTKYLKASGIFLVHEDIDNEIFITSLKFARDLLDYPNDYSALEVQLQPEANIKEVKDKLQRSLGNGYSVKTRKEQNELIYKIFRSEKWFTYAILALVLVISSFNIFGSLIMLVLDKKKDIGVLKSMGATNSKVKKTFVWQGNYIAILGGISGITLAVLLVLGQKRFEWLKLENSIVEAYPVELMWSDVFLTAATVLILGFLISLYPASKAAKVDVQNIN
jgi:lipoprotein-releasing system permease protein